jgi:translation elongation factor EF-G
MLSLRNFCKKQLKFNHCHISVSTQQVQVAYREHLRRSSQVSPLTMSYTKISVVCEQLTTYGRTSREQVNCHKHKHTHVAVSEVALTLETRCVATL